MAAGRFGYNLTDQGVRRCAEMFPEEAEQVPAGADLKHTIHQFASGLPHDEAFL